MDVKHLLRLLLGREANEVAATIQTSHFDDIYKYRRHDLLSWQMHGKYSGVSCNMCHGRKSSGHNCPHCGQRVNEKTPVVDHAANPAELRISPNC